MEIVERWFGPAFGQLHPLLQRLHREGGTLSGPLTVQLGRGFAGFLGRFIGKRMGVPIAQEHYRLKVQIKAQDGAMHWSRCFIAEDGSTHAMHSRFVPRGHYAKGDWLEATGALAVRLTVDIAPDGGWHWRVLGMRLHGIPLPIGLFPQSQAYKRVVNGQYEFSVRFVMPGLGLLLSYGGLLTFTPNGVPLTTLAAVDAGVVTHPS